MKWGTNSSNSLPEFFQGGERRIEEERGNRTRRK
jgi:hypothetical protein